MSLLDPKWKYIHSTATDIRKTFAKARREIGKKDQAKVRPPKLQLMRAPVVLHGKSADLASDSSSHDTRTTGADVSSEHRDVNRTPAAPARSPRTIASW